MLRLASGCHRKIIKIRRELAPQLHIANRQNIVSVGILEGLHLHAVEGENRILGFHAYHDLTFFHVWINLQIADGRHGAQFNTSQHAVPHNLGIVGVAMSQIVYGYVVQLAIVYGER